MKNEEQKLAKPRLIILSDLWGKEKSDWMTYYLAALENSFDIKYYDVCVLGDVDKSKYEEANLHAQFVAGGIENAVKNLEEEEKESICVLGFSIGGSIAWKASLAGLKVQNLFAVCSTRLRYEAEKPSASIQLFYGENDAYQPDIDWLKKMDLKPIKYSNEGHECYQKKEIAEAICKVIIHKNLL